MFHQVPQKASSFYSAGIDTLPLSTHPAHPKSHPAMELGNESRYEEIHWVANSECVSPQFMEENMQFLPTSSPVLHTNVREDPFPFPSTSTESSPHMSQLAMSDRQSTFNGESGDFPDNNDHNKTSTRRSQNRQAQRRFRERKEMQKAELLSRLDKLQSKHDQMANLLEGMRKNNNTLAADKKQLEREVEMLRKWREKILGVMANIVQHDRTSDDLLTKVATSCSVTCWRKGLEYSRTLIIMQTLLDLFDEFQIGERPERTGRDQGGTAQNEDGEKRSTGT
ncbi:hypothetical protein BJX76DRAFT_363219 [Aspergillus varians]